MREAGRAIRHRSGGKNTSPNPALQPASDARNNHTSEKKKQHTVEDDEHTLEP